MPDIPSMKAETPELNQNSLKYNVERDEIAKETYYKSQKYLYYPEKWARLGVGGKGWRTKPWNGEAEVGTSIRIQLGCDIFQGESKEI